MQLYATVYVLNTLFTEDVASLKLENFRGNEEQETAAPDTRACTRRHDEPAPAEHSHGPVPYTPIWQGYRTS